MQLNVLLTIVIEKILPIFISLIPVMVLFSFLFYKGRKEKIPTEKMVFFLFCGIFLILLCQIIESNYLRIGKVYSDISFNKLFENSYFLLLVTIFEEGLKFILLFVIATFFKLKDPYRIMIYSVFLSFGFGIAEAGIYVSSEANVIQMTNLTIAKAFTTLPLHVACGAITGYYFFLLHISKKYTWQLFFKVLLIPIFMHGIYNIVFTNIALVPMLFDEGVYNLGLVASCFYVGIIYLIAVFLIKEAVMLDKFFTSNKEYPEKFLHLMHKNEYE